VIAECGGRDRASGARLSPRLAALVQTVREVAQGIILPRYRSAVRSRKADGSFLTEVDLKAQQGLARSLIRIERCPVLGEEMNGDEQQQLWQKGLTEGLWCIDPIDGTTNFANGIPVFAVSVALMVSGRSEIGVVYNPASDEAFYAERGRGSFMNGTRLPLRSASLQLCDCVAGVDFKRIPKVLGDHLAIAPPYYSQRNFGCSTLEWCYVAAGMFDLYLHGGQMLWDYAAGQLILQEAGGSMASLLHDDFDADNLWKRSVIAAASPELFALWRDWLRSHT
jgi:3'(2'), 5'-bisphosphate nucleotidase/myo-inositol-1(or 4)-monophosphatase